MKNQLESPTLQKELGALFPGQLRSAVSMAQLSYLKVGGSAPLLLEFHGESDLQSMLEYLRKKALPYKVLGLGTNILFPDTCLEYVLLKPSVRNIQKDSLKINPESSDLKNTPQHRQTILARPSIEFPAGMPLVKALRSAQALGFIGLEFFLGIPGSVGGAIRMNAGVPGREIQDVLCQARIFKHSQQSIQSSVPQDLNFTYRSSNLDPRDVICSASFYLEAADSKKIEEAKAQSLQDLKLRRQKQPLGVPSLGSTFKNPKGDYAARLIEVAGLKGKKLGGMAISAKHANFLINHGGGLASEATALIHEIQESVWRQFAIRLEPEIVFFSSKK